jgi:hypothetical protein
MIVVLGIGITQRGPICENFSLECWKYYAKLIEYVRNIKYSIGEVAGLFWAQSAMWGLFLGMMILI